MQITGKVVARNVSEKDLTKKSGGTYRVHSFVVEVPNRSNYPDHYAFKTVQSNVIAEIREGYEVNVEFSIESRAWKEKDGSFKLKEDTYSGSEMYQCFVEFYASKVEVLNSDSNEEELKEHNADFSNQVSTPQVSYTEPDDDLPF